MLTTEEFSEGEEVRKKSTVGVAPSNKDVHGGMEVKIVMSSPTELPFYYVNHIEVSQSPHEFAIVGGRAPARLTDDQAVGIKEDGKLVVDPSVQMIVPIGIIPGLIRALKLQMEKYESVYGKIPNNSKD